MDTATAAIVESKPAVTGADLLDSPAVRKAKAKLTSAKKAKGAKKPAKKSKKAKAKKAAKVKAKKVAKKSKAAKVTKRKRVGPHVTFKRDQKLKAKLVKALSKPRTVLELAKLMKVGKTMGQQYIVSLKAAGVKLKEGKERQGKRGPKALTYVVA